MQRLGFAMRYDDEGDPKQPQPTKAGRKGTNAWESDEAGDLRPTRKDHDRDRHRHVRL